MATWKPTPIQVELIKTAAAREARIRVKAVSLQPGIRFNTKDKSLNEKANTIKQGELNIALVQSADDPNWNDTDLWEYGYWSDFRRGVALTEDGRAILDFYIRNRYDRTEELLGNVEVYYQDGKVVRIKGYPTEYPHE